MISYSKLLAYSCYEAGHTWHPSCSKCSFDMFASAGIASLKIYALVYLLTALVSKKKITKSYAIQLAKNYIRSCVFLAINGSAFVGFFCILRHVLGHINFLSTSWLPSFIASILAISAERRSRRSLLAIYVSNVASESFWNVLKSRGYVKPIPNGEVMLFVTSMILFGFCFKSDSDFSPLIISTLEFIIGCEESGRRLQPKSNECKDLSKTETEQRKHLTCPHEGPCITNVLKSTFSGGVKGYLIQIGLDCFSVLPKLIVKPSSLVYRILVQKSAFRTAAAFASFSAIFKIVCCVSRRICDEDKPRNGAYAGGLAALAMLFQPSQSLATYSCWKALEVLWNEGVEAGRLPKFPFGIELLYSFSTAYLFHLAVMDCNNLKPSYWRFLLTLSNRKIGEFNRSLFGAYGVDASDQKWPMYDQNFLSEKFLQEFIHKHSL